MFDFGIAGVRRQSWHPDLWEVRLVPRESGQEVAQTVLKVEFGQPSFLRSEWFSFRCEFCGGPKPCTKEC